MFDGNVVVGVFDELILRCLVDGDVLLLVVIGYCMLLCIDCVGCIFDYIFVSFGQVDQCDLFNGLFSGGVDVFFDLLCDGMCLVVVVQVFLDIV